MTQQTTQTTDAQKAQKSRHQQKVGTVVSNKMDKTIVVAVESLKKHLIYKRTYKQTKRFQAHDEENTCQVCDLVPIEETRPLSKMKHWRLVEILKRGSGIVPVEVVLSEADPDLTSIIFVLMIRQPSRSTLFPYTTHPN